MEENNKEIHKEEHKVHIESSSEEKLINERKEKLIGFFKNNPSLVFVIVIIALVILGVYIRSMPLSDHNGKPGLWDITTNDYTLGPDLDPFLFLRYAKNIIDNGSLPQIDIMRNVPLGFDTTSELQMVSYMIVMTYKLVNIFGDYSANFAGAFMPVIFFGLTIIVFFLFAREIFIRRKEKESYLKANIIASISTLFMIVIPEFISRTVAGIPEKESVAFFFMFLSFYLFLRAWKSEKIVPASILGILAGIATGLMGLTWGGVTYIYVTIALGTLAAFLINKVGKKESLVYSVWLVSGLILTFLMTTRYSLVGFITSIDTGLATLTLGILIAHLLLWETKLKEILRLEKINIPKSIVSIILTVIIGAVVITIINPSFIIEKASALYHTLVKPVTGRWSTTVAENRQPYFSEWLGSFGKIFFWIFVIGSAVLFKKAFSSLDKNKSWILTGLYCLFFAGLVFSRYAAHPAILDGEGIISLIFYFGSALLLFGFLIYYYIQDYKNKENKFAEVEYEYLLLFALLVLCLFTARSAVRLIMVLAPITPIFVAYLCWQSFESFKNSKEETKKLIIGILLAVILILSVFAFIGFFKTAKSQAYNSVPYYYTFQWQKAMDWVRDETPANAVFAHWWDYGYWLQSIGNRATVTDGGNAITWWNYLMGRYVLTGDNQKQSLEFLWNHNATHLLIDSSDIGKYGAFSQIGSDAEYDRLSSGPITFISDPKQVQEKKNELLRSYNMPVGGGRIALSPMEEDLTYESNGSKTVLFSDNTGVAGVNIAYSNEGTAMSFKQPEAIFVSQGKQIAIPLRYMYYNGKLYDFKTGINAAAYVIQRIYNSGSGLQMDNFGALIYLSPRIMKGLLGQVYVLDNSLGNFDNFKLTHTQPDFILEQISNSMGSGAKLGDFVYYEGLRGPIKIWEITYSGEEKINEEYLARQPPSYITWKF